MEENKPNNSNRKMISIISSVAGLIIVSLLIIGGALLSSKRWDPRWNPFRANPDNSTVEQI